VSALIIKTVKLPKRLAASLSRVAKARGCSESQLIREGVEQVTTEDGLDMDALIGADLGVGRGPRDLSHARKHRARYGRSRDR
jgi:hypothetical protein